MATITDFLTGFEHGVLSATGVGLFSSVVNAAALSIDTAIPRNGARCLKVSNTTAVATYVTRSHSSSRYVTRFAVRLGAMPPVAIHICDIGNVNGESSLFINAAGELRMTIGGTAEVLVASGLTTGVWYLIECAFDTSASPASLRCRFNGGAPVETTRVQTAAASTLIALGCTDPDAQTAAGVFFDDWIMGDFEAGDTEPWYGDGKIEALVPVAAGTHSGGGNFTNRAGGAASYADLAELPMDTSYAGGTIVRKSAAGSATDYFEVQFGDRTHTESVINAVRAIDARAHSSGTGTVTGMNSKIFHSSIGDVGIQVAPDPGAAIGWYANIIDVPAGGWTNTIVNELVGRVGYTNDVSPIGYWYGLILEVDSKVVSATPVGISRQLVWSNRAPVGVSRILRHNISGRTSMSRTLVWNSRSRVAHTRSLVWNVASGTVVAISRILRWNVGTRIGVTRSLVWNVRTKIGAARSILWNVLVTEVPAALRAWPRRSQLIPNLHYELDGHVIQVAGEPSPSMTTVANGGYATLRVTASETDMRRFPSSFEQGAPMRIRLGDGRIVGEYEIDANPIADNGMVELDGSGPRSVAEERDDPYLLQSRDTGLFSDEAGAPFNGTPSAHIAASVAEGALHFSVSEGAVVAQDDAHALVARIQGSTARRFRGSMYVSGSGTGYSILVYRMTGPTGARTLIGTTAVSNGALIDAQPATAEDSIVVELRRTGTNVTQADDLTVDIRDMRINDLTLLDDFSVSSAVSDIGRRLGWDVDGIPSGPGVDTANPAIQIDTYLVGQKFRVEPGGPGWNYWFNAGTYETLIKSEFFPAVLTNPLNVLPLAWGGRWGGNWAELLDVIASLVDWRWIAGGNVFGRGPLLHFGPYGPEWQVSLSKDALPQLRPQPVFNVVVVRYSTADRGMAEVRVRADPDPLRFRGRRDRTHVIELPGGIQPNATLATIIANAAIAEVSRPRITGTIDLTGGTVEGDMTIFDVVGGHMVVLEGFGPAGRVPLRIQETAAGPAGVKLGIGQPSSVESILALEAKRQMQKPFGTLFRRREKPGPFALL